MNAIAIDGPSGGGKSSIAKAVAEKFGYMYVDTGAIYRTIGLAAVRRGIDPKDREKVIPMLPELSFELKYNENDEQCMILDGEDVSTEIRRQEISMAASDVSAIPEVRAFLMDVQRSLAKKYNVIMDGRDIGTVILPDAPLKIFLTASPEARAKRRYNQLLKKGMEANYDDVYRELLIRDEQDTKRAASPLVPADDAVILDSSDMVKTQVVDLISKLVTERFGLE